ncbi:MAG: TatD family hydrolase [Eggerthellaceae bacterium]|nr:TatD family hydrolase [Eggerthellaceae bacterium]
MLDDVPLALARCAVNGVRFLECITDPSDHGDDEKSAAEVYALLPSWLDEAAALLAEWGSESELPRVRMASGVHPHNAKDWGAARDELIELLRNPLTSCLGEIGLDYHYDFSPRDVQREVVALELQLAHEAGLPVQLHIREGHTDALAILREQGCPPAGAVLHCFNLDAAVLEPFLELGCAVTLGGPLTFKKEWETRAAALIVPPERLMTETDAPFMAPEPLRGCVCQPDYVLYTVRGLLDCFGYAGDERGVELVNPRTIDVPEGEEPPQRLLPDFAELQQGMDERAFAQRLYTNAVEFFDRSLTDWQRG